MSNNSVGTNGTSQKHGSERVRVLFFDAKTYDREYFNKFNINKKIDITYINDHLNEETVKLTQGFDAICIFVNDNANAKVVEVLHKNGVRLIALRCSGYNNVNFSTLHSDIRVVRVPAYSPHAVAEYTVGMMLAANRKPHRAYYRIRDNNFTLNGLIGFDMYNRTAGVIGTGKIGRYVAQILRGMDMRVLGYDLYPDKKWASQYGVEMVDLTQIYRQSDIITLHCPLTTENMYMINRGSINLMKDRVMIVNTGRGQLINTNDLIDALKRKKVGAAALDVYEEEMKYFFEDHSSDDVLQDDTLARLLSFSNVLITSHQAFFTEEAMTQISQTTLNNISQYFFKNILENEVAGERNS